jgi:hypothetical protein
MGGHGLADVESVGEGIYCSSLNQKKELGSKFMGSMLIQGLIWIAAAALLLVYLKRRRNRRTLP